ncbi:hypothetical protein [Deinococcus aquatilis]|uniref:hypothetical protein n=1 Tax=Deinococcus aquatilis TaxID=519440 RepID=UPI0012FA84C4|nr:hypothetical protein [Deinococcus aquatilis]
MTTLEFYKNDPIHIAISNLETGKAALYGLILLKTVRQYPSCVAVSSSFLARYNGTIDLHIKRIFHTTPAPSWQDMMQTYEGLLDEAIELGDNALESCICIPHYLASFEVNGDLNNILYANVSFLGFCDYISQEYEIKERRPSEARIASSKTMSAYRVLTNQLILSLNTDGVTDPNLLEKLSDHFRETIRDFLVS